MGGVVDSIEYREDHVIQKVNSWLDELNMLCDIARIERQEAYSCFVSECKHKLTYIRRTIRNTSHQLEKTEEVMLTKFIPAITGGIYVNPDERYLLPLPAKYGGLGIPIFSELSGIEFKNSQIMSEDLRNKTIEQERTDSQQQEEKTKENNNKIRNSKQGRYHSILQRLCNDMSDEQRRLNEINQQQGASYWLTTLPIKEEGYTINKNYFWDLLRLRYGWQLQRLPTNCECGACFTMDHALSRKKGDFISLRHSQIRDLTANCLNIIRHDVLQTRDLTAKLLKIIRHDVFQIRDLTANLLKIIHYDVFQIRDLTANLLKIIRHDVLIEPTLQQLTGESLHERNVNITGEARVDIVARGFWISGQWTFFNIRVFNPIARGYGSQELTKAYEINEREKKRQFNERILEVEHGSFTPLS